MDELLEDIATEKERIEQTLQALRLTLERNERSFVELAAIATCLHNVYNGMENLIKRVLKFLCPTPKVPIKTSLISPLKKIL